MDVIVKIMVHTSCKNLQGKMTEAMVYDKLTTVHINSGTHIVKMICLLTLRIPESSVVNGFAHWSPVQ